MEDKVGIRFILFTIPGRDIAFVENNWFCEVIIQGEGIINYHQFARIYNIEPLELLLDLPDINLLQPKNQG